MDAYALQDGAAEVIALATRANRYVEETAPWRLAKEKKDAELDSVLANLARTVARLASLAQPFLPASAETVWRLLAMDAPLADVRWAALVELPVEGHEVGQPPILFPKPSGDALPAQNVVT